MCVTCSSPALRPLLSSLPDSGCTFSPKPRNGSSIPSLFRADPGAHNQTASRPASFEHHPVPLPIEDYALIGDCETAALVGRDGSIDWLCIPRFDSDACFAALLGGPENGRWLIAPEAEEVRVSRRYRGNTLILETTFDTSDGKVLLVDFMPPESEGCDLMRLVIGLEGQVRMRTELIIRFDYGATVPWVTRDEEGDLCAVAGPQMLLLRTPVSVRGEEFKTVGEFSVKSGECVPFVLSYAPSHLPPPKLPDCHGGLQDTEQFWEQWAATCKEAGRWTRPVLRSLITLKALTFAPTGGIVAAPTTSLPERTGGKRNWDYRFCWIRDSIFTVWALASTGAESEAVGVRHFIQRSAAGNAGDLQVLYAVDGKRRLTEIKLDHLEGWRGSRPVRIGNGAERQYQADMYGLVLELAWQWSERGHPPSQAYWRFLRSTVDAAISKWELPDRGIWEVRSRP